MSHLLKAKMCHGIGHYYNGPPSPETKRVIVICCVLEEAVYANLSIEQIKRYTTYADTR